MSQQLDTTELDFDTIKQNLKDYFLRTGSEFEDWNFEGSGLNTLLNVLAYNTHYNAVNAHMAMNESFLDSAQLRANVVSRAKLLGYTPTSKSSPIATIDLPLLRKPSSTAEEYTLPAGTKFTTEIDDVAYTFQTIEDHTVGVDFDNNSPTTAFFLFQSIDIYEGFLKTKEYTVDNSTFQRFVVDDVDADVSTLTVDVYSSVNDQTPETYTRFSSFTNIDGTSPIYFLNENGDGFYDVTFGNDVIGKSLGSLNIVRLRYLATSGVDANSAKSFLYVGGLTEDNTTEGVGTINLLSAAQGGGEKESVSSIKFNAPLTFISQDRAISAEDYKTLIRQNINNVKDVSVWGGEDNDIPNYGEVNISITPLNTTQTTLTDVEKETVISFLATRASLGITPILRDPLYTYLYFEVFFKYDVTKTTLNKQELVSLVRSTISDFNSNNLNNFDGVFRFSNFLKSIDDSEESILSSVARLYAYKNLTINVLNTVTSNEGVDFGFELDGDVRQTTSMISSDPWLYNDEYIQLGDEPISGDLEKRNIFVFIPKNDGTIDKIVSSVGYLYPDTGKLTLTNLPASVQSTIKVKVRPASDDLVAKKREVLSISGELTSVVGDIDSSVSGTSSLLSDFNTVSRDR